MTRFLTASDVRRLLQDLVVESRGDFPGQPVVFRIDSREVTLGDGFLALRGSTVDGNDFVSDALARGAGVVITERPASDNGVIQVNDTLAALHELARLWRREQQVRIVGITGSVGKTTTKELTADVLSAAGPTLRNAANWNTEIGVPLTLLGLTSDHRWAVLEMAMRGSGQIRDLARIATPDVGVVTNVGQVHAELLGSLDAIAWAKSELIRELGPDGVAVLNVEDPRVAAMARKAACRVVEYGFRQSAAIRADKVSTHGLDGVTFDLVAEGRSTAVNLKLPGRHNALNAAAAAAVGLTEGLALETVVAALESSVPYRMRRVSGVRGSLILDDSYNASPASMRSALDVLVETEGRHVAVLGDMRELGQYEEDAHLDVGAYAADRADIIVTVGEKGRLIADAAREKGHHAAHAYPTKEDAAADLRKNLRAGDVVLVKASRALALETIVNELEAEP